MPKTIQQIVPNVFTLIRVAGIGSGKDGCLPCDEYREREWVKNIE